jgi:hypothetical protein
MVFWRLLKRALKGTYVNVESFHLNAYVDESRRSDSMSAATRMATVGASPRRCTRSWGGG